jgi:hypothetical protein
MLEPVIPRTVIRALESAQKVEHRARRKHAEKLAKAFHAGDMRLILRLCRAAETGEEAGLGEIGQRACVQGEINSTYKKPTNRSPAAREARQSKLVDSLTRGYRISVSRAAIMAGYSKRDWTIHEFLKSPHVRRQFKAAIQVGRPLPSRYKAKIEEALRRDEIAEEYKNALDPRTTW